MVQLNQRQQRLLLAELPTERRMAVRRVCRGCEQRGEGIKDILIKVKKVLGPIASVLGPVVLKKFIVPMLLKKAGVSGSGKKKTPAKKRKKKP